MILTINDNEITKYGNDKKIMKNDKELTNDRMKYLVVELIEVKYRKDARKRQVNTF